MAAMLPVINDKQARPHSVLDAGPAVNGGHGGLHDRKRLVCSVGERLATAHNQLPT